MYVLKVSGLYAESIYFKISKLKGWSISDFSKVYKVTKISILTNSKSAKNSINFQNIVLKTSALHKKWENNLGFERIFAASKWKFTII